MRKFTLFLALMVTMVTSAFAQGSEVIDIASNADAMLYSNAPCKVTTWGDDFKGWHVLFDDDASTFFHSDYSGDDSVDGLDHYWRVDMGEGNSVSLFTFTFTTRNTNCDVNSPTTIVVEGSNEADGTYTEIATLTGLPTTNSTVYTSETLGSEDVAYRYIRYRVTATKTNQAHAGHVFFFIAEFGMSKVKAGAVLANINYTYTYNGETIGSATATAFVGDAYPEPTNVPFGYHAATPEGTVEGDKDITIECTLKLPFEYAESVDAIKTWYYMQMHSNNKRYIQYVEGASSLEWADAEVAEGEEDSYTWAFVGTPATGFKLVNRAAGTELAVCSDGSNDPALGAFADAVNWTPAASDIPGEAYFCLQYPGSSNYMNAQNGKVAYWNDNDAGSTLLLTKREITAVEPEPEPEPEPESGIDTSKEYYLYSSYNSGMNKGYLTIGTKSGANYGPAYMANEKLQAFKLTPAADGGYTLSREADMGGMSYTEYIDCTHAYNVANNAMSGSTLYFELNTNNKYNIRSANGYFKADMISYGTDGYAYHVFSNGDMTSALEWELIPVEDVVDPEQPAAEPLKYVSHTPATPVESISEVTITFDREVGYVSSDLSNVKLKLGSSTTRGMSSAINGNSVTIYLSANVNKSGEYTLEIPADIIKATDGGVFAGTTLTIIVDAAPALTSKTTVNVDNTLSAITAEFDSEIEFAAESDITVLNVYVQNTETVAATVTVANNATIEGNVLTLTLDEAIAPEVTTKYTVEIPAGWIVKKGSDKAFAGKKLTYTVKIPFAVKSITPASGSTVEVFEKIVAEYNAAVDFYPSAMNFKLINIADNSEIALVAAKDGNTVTFTAEVEVPNGTYTLANLNNVVDKSTYNAPAELPEYTITVKAADPIVETESRVLELTFNKISATEANVVVVESNVEASEITATITSNYNWKELTANSEAFPNASIVCPDKNAKDMTAGNEGTITLTLSNVPEGYSFKNVTFTSVALNGGGVFQGDDVNAQLVDFTLTKGETTLGVAEDVKIKVNSSPTEYNNTKNQSVTVPFEVAETYTAENGTLELKLTLSAASNNGCFYGLIKVAIDTEVAVAEPEVDEATVALIATAKELIALEGIGYPAAAPRAELQAAIDAAEAAATTEAGTALQAAINAYYTATDVVLPEDGKVYTFKAVYGNNKFYIYNNNGILAVAACGDEELPESAKFICEYDSEDNYMFQFKTADGAYYLAYPTLGGKSWLDGESATGLEAESAQVTKFNINKILGGNDVAAQNSELLGLVKLDGYRGYDNTKDIDSYGPIVVKHSVLTFDGAAAPYYNSNFTSAFCIEETKVVVTPLSVVAVTPNEAVETLQEITIEFDAEIAIADLTGTDRIAINYLGLKNTFIYTTATVEGKVLKLVADSPIKDKGTHYLTIPAGVVTRASDGVAYEGGKFEFEVKEKAVEPLTVVKVTPEAEVRTLDVITIEFSHNVFVNAMGTAVATIANADKSINVTITDIQCEGNVVTFNLGENAITVAGEYTLDIPSGIIARNDGVKYSGTHTFTVVAPKTFAVNAYIYEGDATEIKSIRVEAGQGASLADLPTGWTFTNEAGEEFEMDIQWMYDFEEIFISFNPSITEAGTYTLTIPAGSLKTDGGKECEAATFSWTVVDTTGIDGVDAEGEQTIYDLTGRKIETITKGGIYIINGKKVVVK